MNVRLGTVAGLTMDFSIFEAFPNAIVSGVWEIGECKHGTIIGNEFKPIGPIDVIIDEGFNSNINSTPETLTSDMLIYCYPSQMPSLSANTLVSAYMIHNIVDNTYFMINDVGMGKNQHTGQLEHIELQLVQTEIANE